MIELIRFLLLFCVDIALWSTNGSEVDVFLKKSQIDDVRQVLNDNHIHYSVLIEDMQTQIEKENPPQHEIEALQNRNGKSKFIKFCHKFIANHKRHQTHDFTTAHNKMTLSFGFYVKQNRPSHTNKLNK